MNKLIDKNAETFVGNTKINKASLTKFLELIKSELNTKTIMKTLSNKSIKEVISNTKVPCLIFKTNNQIFAIAGNDNFFSAYTLNDKKLVTMATCSLTPPKVNKNIVNKNKTLTINNLTIDKNFLNLNISDHMLNFASLLTLNNKYRELTVSKSAKSNYNYNLKNSNANLPTLDKICGQLGFLKTSDGRGGDTLPHRTLYIDPFTKLFKTNKDKFKYGVTIEKFIEDINRSNSELINDYFKDKYKDAKNANIKSDNAINKATSKIHIQKNPITENKKDKITFETK